MSDMQTKNVSDRLLDTAERLFCEKGFEGTSIRDITSESNCNIASVNYHFGGKNKLYIEMFRRHFGRIVADQTKNIKDIMEGVEPTLEKLLRTVVRYAIKSLKADSNEKPLLKMLVREMLNPHLKGKILADDMFINLQIYFNESVCKFCDGLDTRNMTLCMFSLDGLLTHSLLFSDYYKAAVQDLSFDELVEHIVNFTCAGIRNKIKRPI